MDREEIIQECNELSIEDLREVADYCNNLADCLEQDADEVGE